MLLSRWKYAMIPAILTHCCIGIIYCWSLLYGYISVVFGNDSNLGWAFSLSVFSLGLSAAIFGPLINKNYKLAGIISSLLFSFGFILSGVSLWIGAKWLFYIGFGIFSGISIGMAYMYPIKVAMSWYDTNRQGLAIGLILTSFGIGKLIYSPLIIYGSQLIGISWIFIFIGIFGALVIGISSQVMKYRTGVDKTYIMKSNVKNVKDWFKNTKKNLLLPGFLTLWTIMFLNTTVGLAIISHENWFYLAAGIGILIGAILSGTFNALGRFCIGWWSDTFFVREKMLGIILVFSGISCFISFLNPIFIPISILVCNFGFGAMFSIIPTILANRYGVEKIIETHGLILSSWALAGLIGNQASNLLIGLNSSANQTIMLVNSAIYIIALYMSTKFWKENKKEKEN